MVHKISSNINSNGKVESRKHKINYIQRERLNIPNKTRNKLEVTGYQNNGLQSKKQKKENLILEVALDKEDEIVVSEASENNLGRKKLEQYLQLQYTQISLLPHTYESGV